MKRPMCLVPHEAEMTWHVQRRRWCCALCGRRVRFMGANAPYHRWWWR